MCHGSFDVIEYAQIALFPPISILSSVRAWIVVLNVDAHWDPDIDDMTVSNMYIHGKGT